MADLIYTATNRRGAIIEANSAFTRVSGYDRRQLLGVPHNLIRHPGMPAGAFRAIWTELMTGRAASGYVQNLTADGTSYWTFATFTPGGGGHLSIRQRPCSMLLPRIDELYADVRALELELREAGVCSTETAVRGEARLLAGLGTLGFADYRDFVLATLPAEVAARAAQGGGMPVDGPQRPGLAELFTAAERSEERVRDLAVALYENRGDDDELSRMIAAARGNAQALGTTSRVGEALGSVISTAEALRSARHRMRCSAALAQLQAEMLGRYLCSLDAGEESCAAAAHTVERLTDALHQQFQGIGGGLRLSRDMAGHVDDLEQAIRRAVASEAIAVAAQHLAGMRAMAGRFATAVSGFDPVGASRDIVRLDQVLRGELV